MRVGDRVKAPTATHRSCWRRERSLPAPTPSYARTLLGPYLRIQVQSDIVIGNWLSLLPLFPLGTEMTSVEQALVEPLGRLGEVGYGDLARMDVDDRRVPPGRRVGEDLLQVRLVDVVRAGARDEAAPPAPAAEVPAG